MVISAVIVRHHNLNDRFNMHEERTSILSVLSNRLVNAGRSNEKTEGVDILSLPADMD